MSRLVLRVVVLAALLWGGTALAAKMQAAEGLSQGISSLWQKHVPAWLLASGLLLGAYQLPALADDGEHAPADHADVDHADTDHGEEAPQVWTEHMTQETYDSVFYMSTSQEGNPTIRHVLYIGETDEGDHLFAGLYMYFLEAHQGNLRFYASNGQLLAEGVSRVDVKVFPDPFNDFNVVNLFTINGLELEETPTRLAL